MTLLEALDLHVKVGDAEVLRGVSLGVGEAEVHFLMGPNAAGKTTFLSALAGLPRVRVVSGRVLLDGEDVTGLPVVERARRGVALAYQIPPELVGVPLRSLAKLVSGRFGTGAYVEELSRRLRLEHLMGRDSFRGFSGGERKRAELFLVALMRPRLALLDEPDSGVDLDSLWLIADALSFVSEEFGTAMIVVTHTRALIEKVGGTAAHVLCDGRIVYSGAPGSVAGLVEEKGFRGLCGEADGAR